MLTKRVESGPGRKARMGGFAATCINLLAFGHQLHPPEWALPLLLFQAPPDPLQNPWLGRHVSSRHGLGARVLAARLRESLCEL